MPSQRSSQFGDLRAQGLQIVFETIRNESGIARVDIAQRIGASPSTVTSIASELMDQGLIAEIAQAKSATRNRRGRPRVGLKVRGEAHLIAGLKLARNSISAIIVDFEGRDVASAEIPLEQSCMSSLELAKVVRDALLHCCASADISFDRLSGVGIGLAGLVDGETQFVHWSPSLNERSVPLGAPLEAHLGCPVFLDNDANLVAQAEQLFGLGRGVRDFIVLTLEHGMGMGIVINHQIYRGARGCGAEFGHTKVQLGGALCQCGQRGCLEAYVGDYALLRAARQARPGPSPQSLPDLWSLAKSGDPAAVSVFDQGRRMFALGLANVVNLFDPQLIILAGQRASFEHLDAERAVAEMTSDVVQVSAPLPKVVVHQWGDLMWAKGAAARALEGVSALSIRDIAKAG